MTRAGRRILAAQTPQLLPPQPEEEGERHYKLVLSQTDKDSLIAIVAGSEQPEQPRCGSCENYGFFESRIAAAGAICILCAKDWPSSMVVDIALSRDQDNPQLIFESMNSTGRELSQADLIRNFILMGLEPELQTQLYERYLASPWRWTSGKRPTGRTSTASCVTT